MRVMLLTVCLVVTAAAAGLWTCSWGGGWTADFSVHGYKCHCISHEGTAALTIFRAEAEDPVFHEWNCRYWMIALPAAIAAGLAGWWWWRGRRWNAGRGFPVE